MLPAARLLAEEGEAADDPLHAPRSLPWHRVGGRRRIPDLTPFTPAEMCAIHLAGGMLMGRSISAGSAKQYDNSMANFDEYILRLGGTPGFLDVEVMGMRAVESVLIDFVSYMIVIVGRAYSTVEGYLQGIRARWRE